MPVAHGEIEKHFKVCKEGPNHEEGRDRHASDENGIRGRVASSVADVGIRNAPYVDVHGSSNDDANDDRRDRDDACKYGERATELNDGVFESGRGGRGSHDDQSTGREMTLKFQLS